MKIVPIETCLKNSGGSIYNLAILLARRARDLSLGEKSLVPDVNKDKYLLTALEEIEAGHFTCIEPKDKKTA